MRQSSHDVPFIEATNREWHTIHCRVVAEGETGRSETPLGYLGSEKVCIPVTRRRHRRWTERMKTIWHSGSQSGNDTGNSSRAQRVAAPARSEEDEADPL